MCELEWNRALLTMALTSGAYMRATRGHLNIYRDVTPNIINCNKLS